MGAGLNGLAPIFVGGAIGRPPLQAGRIPARPGPAALPRPFPLPRANFFAESAIL